MMLSAHFSSDDRVLGIGRYKDGKKLLALFNFGDKEVIVHIGDTNFYIDLITTAPRGASAVNLRPKDFAWLYCDNVQ